METAEGRPAGPRIARAALLLVSLQGIEQITALGKQMVIAAQFGTSQTLDAYLVATTLTGLVLTWVSLPVNQTLIPMFRHDLARRGEADAWGNASVLFNNLAVILAVLALGVGLGVPWLVRVVAPGFDPEAAALATTLARVMIPTVLFAGLGAVLSQIYFSYERFFVPGIVDTVGNLVVVAVLLWAGQTWGIHGLAVAILVGSLPPLLLQLPIVWEKRRLYSPRVDLRHPQMAEMGRLGLPLLLSAGGAEVGRITDRMFASLLPGGRLSALSYAQRLTALQYDLLVRPLQRSTYPHFAQLTAEGKFPALSRRLFLYLRVMFFATVPVAVLVAMLADPIVRLLFQRGAFDETSVRLTSQALALYALGVPAMAMSRIIDRTFVTLKDTVTPTRWALVRIAIKIVLSFLLIRPLAHLGIAVAEIASQVVRLPFLFRALPREIRGRETGPTLASFGRTVLAATAMAAAISVAAAGIVGTLALPVELVALAVLGAGVFAGLGFVLLNEEARTVLGAVGALRGRSSSDRSRPEES